MTTRSLLDTRSEDDFTLFAGERLVSLEEIPVARPERLPSAEKALCRLARVNTIRKVGCGGPLISALPTEENAGHGALDLFQAVFGRDSLFCALILAPFFPELLEQTVLHLAAWQGRSYVPRREEEPGRIVHELRDPDEDELARRLDSDSGWQWPYFGAIDSTALFVTAACHAARRRPAFMEQEFRARLAPFELRTVRDALSDALAWICERVEQDGNGLFTWQRAFLGSLENQVWKDSWDSYTHADGTIANHDGPLASIDTQGLAYDALLDAIELGRSLGRRVATPRLQAVASSLREATHGLFWVSEPEGDFFALGVDRDPQSGALRPLAVRASNMGWLLSSRLLDGRDRETVRRRTRTVELLLSPELRARYGIRTLSTRENRYRPHAYHNGTVWLFDSYATARGFDRHGFRHEARALEDSIVAACRATNRYPEFVSGDDARDPYCRFIVDIYSERDGRGNRIAQLPQELQAWTVATVIAIRRNALARH